MSGSEPVLPPVQVSGGVGGTSARLDDLRLLAAFCGHVAADLTGEAWRSRCYCLDPDLLLSAALSPATAAAAEEALLAGVLGPTGALATASRALGLAADLEASALAYEQAEEAVRQLWERTDFILGYGIGAAAPAAAIGAAAGLAFFAPWLIDHPRLQVELLFSIRSGELGDQLQRQVTSHPQWVQHLANGGGGLVAGLLAWGGPVGGAVLTRGPRPSVTTEEAAGLLAGWFVDGTPLVRPAGSAAADGADGPRWSTPGEVRLDSLAGLLAAMRRTDEDPAPGRIDVHRISRLLPDRTTSTVYVVTVSGTRDWSPPGRQTSVAADLGGSLRLVAGESTAYARGVVASLERAGVPPGARVALVGHSQGGMAALAAANDPEMQARYHLTHVVTAGSPVATMARPPGVKVLSLENESDIVPLLDGEPNPDRPDLVTVRFAATDQHTVVGNHALDRYVEGAAAADRAAADGDPSLRAYVASLRADGYLVGDDDLASVETSAWVVSALR